MIDLIGWLAALVAALTGLAMLQDATRTPRDRSRVGWFRHLLRLGLLVFITASAAVVLVMPQARSASLYEVALRCSLAGFMAMQSPCPWWRYVFKGGVTSHRRATDV